MVWCVQYFWPANYWYRVFRLPICHFLSSVNESKHNLCCFTEIRGMFETELIASMDVAAAAAAGVEIRDAFWKNRTSKSNNVSLEFGEF